MKLPKNRHRSGKKIKGNLAPFRNTSLDTLSNRLAKGYLNVNELIQLRNIAKDAFGLRFQYAMMKCGKYQIISEDSRNIISKYLGAQRNHLYTARFVECFFNSYNNNVQHTVRINEPKCKTKILEKAITHASKDCIKAVHAYIEPIYKKMEKDRGITGNVLLGKYRDIKAAVLFVCCYIEELYTENLPDGLSRRCFDDAKNLDFNISSHYVYQSETDRYYLINGRNHSYSTVSQPCATYLICCKD